VEKLPFFKNKSMDFQYKVLPLLKERKLYRGDILYAEGDLIDEIIFVLKGSFYLYKDISDMVTLPAKVIDKETQAFNVPYLRYGGGSYFGDEDCLIEIDRDDISENKKYYRESTAECVDDAEIFVIKKR
jgi:CRP-like cAMP-binding protein